MRLLHGVGFGVATMNHVTTATGQAYQSRTMDRKHKQFYRDLAELLDQYDVDLMATDDGEPYGQHSALINVQFNAPYRSDEFTSISADDARQHGFGECEKCGDALTGHEDDSGTRCRWCVTCVEADGTDQASSV